MDLEEINKKELIKELVKQEREKNSEELRGLRLDRRKLQDLVQKHVDNKFVSKFIKFIGEYIKHKESLVELESALKIKESDFMLELRYLVLESCHNRSLQVEIESRLDSGMLNFDDLYPIFH